MKRRTLGPFSVSALGLGCMTLSHAYGNPPDPATAATVLRKAVDLGYNFFDTAALYGSYHRIVPVRPRQAPETPWDVVGPICESSDVFARERMLPPLEVDDLVAILDAGAYGSVMASNYNRHLLPAEVLVDAGNWTVIRRRQTLDDVLSLEA